jgi:dGTPase
MISNRTIECSIMDAADDIAFSTSDLEDSLKGGFVSLMDMLACSHQLAVEVMRKIRNDSEAKQLAGFTAEDVKRVLRELAAIGLALVPGNFTSQCCINSTHNP